VTLGDPFLVKQSILERAKLLIRALMVYSCIDGQMLARVKVEIDKILNNFFQKQAKFWLTNNEKDTFII
jgi:hypothetical protein